MGNVNLSFSWQSLLLALLLLASVVVVVLVAVLIFRLIRLIGKIDLLMEHSSASIETTINKMPDIVQSVEATVEDVQSVTGGISGLLHVFRKFG